MLFKVFHDVAMNYVFKKSSLVVCGNSLQMVYACVLTILS